MFVTLMAKSIIVECIAFLPFVIEVGSGGLSFLSFALFTIFFFKVVESLGIPFFFTNKASET